MSSSSTSTNVLPVTRDNPPESTHQNQGYCSRFGAYLSGKYVSLVKYTAENSTEKANWFDLGKEDGTIKKMAKVFFGTIACLIMLVPVPFVRAFTATKNGISTLCNRTPALRRRSHPEGAEEMEMKKVSGKKEQ